MKEARVKYGCTNTTSVNNCWGEKNISVAVQKETISRNEKFGPYVTCDDIDLHFAWC